MFFSTLEVARELMYIGGEKYTYSALLIILFELLSNLGVPSACIL